MNKKIIKILIFLVLTLFILNLVSAATQDELTKAYHDKLIKAGLTEQEATTIIASYPVETDLRKAVREAIQNKQTEILGVSVEKLKKDFYIVGVFTNLFTNSANSSASFFTGINDFIKGLFGETPGGFFLWLIGVKRTLTDRLLDIVTAVVAWWLIWLLWYFSIWRIEKKRKGKFATDSYYKKKSWLDILVDGNNGSFLTAMFKLFLFTAIYWTAMQIPIANWVLRGITLYNFSPIWLKPIILAMLVGYLPAIAEKLIEYRQAIRDADEEMSAKVAAETLKSLGKYK